MAGGFEGIRFLTDDSPTPFIIILQLVDRSTVAVQKVAFQYFTCLHWAFAQLGVGNVEIEARPAFSFRVVQENCHSTVVLHLPGLFDVIYQKVNLE